MAAKKKTSTRHAPSPSTKSRAPAASRKTSTTRTHPRVVLSAHRPGLGLFDVLVRYGVLRALLAMVGLLLIVFATQPGTAPVYAGWPLVTTVLVPVMAPMIFMLLLLDALMGRVWMIDKTGDEYVRLRTAVVVDLLLAASLLMFWVPYYRALG